MSKTEDLNAEIRNNHPQFRAVIDANHVKDVKGWSFDHSGKYMLINKTGSWFIYLPNGKQFGSSVKELNEAQRIANNMKIKNTVSKKEERQLQKIEEIYEIRKSLELLSLEISIPILSVQKLMEFRKELIENTDNEDIQVHTGLDAKLHSYIIDSTGKKRLIDMLNQLFRLIQSFRSLGFAHKESKESTIKEHIDILDALCRRDLINAKELMRKHIENSKMIALSQLFKTINR